VQSRGRYPYRPPQGAHCEADGIHFRGGFGGGTLADSGASDKSLTVDPPNTIRAEVGERIRLLIARDAVRILPPGD
jgi:hypothetical protein